MRAPGLQHQAKDQPLDLTESSQAQRARYAHARFRSVTLARIATATTPVVSFSWKGRLSFQATVRWRASHGAKSDLCAGANSKIAPALYAHPNLLKSARRAWHKIFRRVRYSMWT